jgi:four helix bundle protein
MEPKPKTEYPKPTTQNPRPQVESWKDLEVWRLAHQSVLRIYKATQSFPMVEQFRLTDQICRAAASVPANIAEGKGRVSLKEYLQFLSIARGSVEEVKYFLLLAKDLGYLSKENYDGLLADYHRIGKMINGLMGSLRNCLPLSQPRKPKI